MNSIVLPLVALAGAVFALKVILNGPFFTHGRGSEWLAAVQDRHERRRMRDPVYALLRREVARIGAEYETVPYQRLRPMDDALTYREVVADGMRLTFNADLVAISRSGDLLVCIDAHAPEASGHFWRSWPSYQFFKRPDDSVYY